MSDGYEVLMSEVLDASRVFGRESRELAGLPLPGVARSTAGACVSGGLPDGGDAMLDAAVAEVLQALGATTGQLAAVVSSHAGKLRACYDRYHAAEEGNAMIFRRLLGLIGGGR